MSEGKAPPRERDQQPMGRSSDGAGTQRQREREPMSSGGLDMRIDAALGEWPMPERSALDWDESADRVMSRIAAGDIGGSAAGGRHMGAHASRNVSDEDLFAAPLAMTSEEAQNSAAFGKTASSGGEGSRMAVTSERRERRSFQELAEMARSGSLTPPPASVAPKPAAPAPAPTTDIAAKGSGVLDLAAVAAADPAGAQRAQTTPLAASGLFEEPSAPSVQHAAAASVARASAAPAPSVPAPHVARAVPTVPPAEKKSGGGVIVLFGGLAVVAAAAAGLFFVVKPRMASDANKVALAPPPAVTQQAPAQTQAQPQAPAPKTDNAIDPTALPLANAPTATAPATAPFPVVSGALPFAAPKQAQPDPSAQALASAAPPATASAAPVASAPPAPTSSASLEEQMRQAAGPSTSGAPTPTPDNAPTQPQGAVPMKPSQGAVSGAISAVMPSARQCLGPDDPISQASIIFQSNGTVQSVSITGGAAGKPAEACIRQALMRAKVAPFAQATFTAYATIRPN